MQYNIPPYFLLVSIYPLFPPTKKRANLLCFSSVFLKFSFLINEQDMFSKSSPSFQTSKSPFEFSWPQIDNQKNTSSGCRDSNRGGPTAATGCWDFLQNSSNTSPDYKHTTTEPSTFFQSSRSLEMCTEILGSESGSYIDPVLDRCLQTTQERQYSSKIKPRKTREICKKTKHSSSFPPPLTSISSGYGGVKVQAHRGGGRLVITAVVSSSACRIYLKSEREDGRLRVFLHKDYYWRSEQKLSENIKENGGKLRRNFKCGDASGSSKNLTSWPLCLV